MQQRELGTTGITVSAIGLGGMGMSEFYGSTDDEVSTRVIHRAIDIGVTFFDTSASYGAGHNERLIGRAIADRRDQVVLATKCGIVREGDNGEKRRIDNSPAYIRQAIDDSLSRLDVDHVDLYYLHRRDPEAPLEDAVAAMAELVEKGKVRCIGLSEVSASTLRRANAIHPIAALQSEYSLMTRGLEAEIIPAAREYGTSIVAYSPLGRGLLTGQLSSVDSLSTSDMRHYQPRFEKENFRKNLDLVARIRPLADQVGCTPGQLVLAWLLSRGEDVVAIPGTKRMGYLEENAAAAGVVLTDDQISALEAAIPPELVAGSRNNPAVLRQLEL